MTTRSLIVSLLAGAAAFAAPSSAAAANLATAAASTCPSLGAIQHPFAAIGDLADYQLTPGGAFDTATTSWSLSGGAALTSAGRSGGAITVPAGGSATSPEFCVQTDHPTMRAFLRGTSLQGLVKVELLYRNATGAAVSQPVAIEPPVSGSWQASKAWPTATALPLLAGERTSLRVRVSAVYGSAMLDEVWLDPARARLLGA